MRKNPRLFADRLAASDAGVVVAMPDYFGEHGGAWPADAPLSADKFQEWLAKHPRERVVKDSLAVIKEAQEKFSPGEGGEAAPLLPVSAVGFCWGGLYATLLSGGSPRPAVASSVLLHPSLLKLEEFKGVSAPMLALFTGEDAQVPDKFRAEIIDVLGEKKAKEGIDTGYHYYEEQRHGFSLRGDDTDPAVSKAATDAFERTKEWIKKHGTV